MPDKIDIDPLLAEIETALLVHEVSATKFGYLAAGDPALLTKLRRGMKMRPGRREKVKRTLRKLTEGDFE